MRVMILGGDGYLGWPAAMSFSARGHETCVIDNYYRRRIAAETNSQPLFAAPMLPERVSRFKGVTGQGMKVLIGDCCDFDFLSKAVRDFAPDVLVHFAEQPSAPYSMIGFEEARSTLSNNVTTTFNVAWAVIQNAPQCHIIKLGSMGEYGTPNIDIEEGWIEIDHNGRREKFLYPRQGGSFYHTTKILDTDLLWFYVRANGLRVTDLMQGPVYGLSTGELDLDPSLMPNFHYDDIFGTVINRFLVQAVAGVPLTVYGSGEQTRGYLNIRDTLHCIHLAAATPAKAGELRIFNQFTEIFSINGLAERVRRVGDSLGLGVAIRHFQNPRTEMERHYYNPTHRGLLELGLQPTLMSDEIVAGMLEQVIRRRDLIVTSRIAPRVRWRSMEPAQQKPAA